MKTIHNNYEIFFRIFVAFYWAAFVFILTAVPLNESVDYEEHFGDKFIHIILFGVLAYLIFKIFELNRNTKFYHAAIFSFMITFVLAITCEYYQAFVSGRYLSELDLLAGLLGAVAAILVNYLLTSQRPKMLLHICCPGCGAYVAEVLKNRFDIYFYYYNPNIDSIEEYEKRFADIEKIRKYLDIGNDHVIKAKCNHNEWQVVIKGREGEREGGKRCRLCFRLRLLKTAEMAEIIGVRYFATSLSISPHKNSDDINWLGNELARSKNLIFYQADFKKDNGFKKSVELSKKLNLYRQNYCGCEYSKQR